MKQKKNKSNKWEDHYSNKAKKENYPARSVYKLEEIQKKFKIIKKGDKILDLGCFPGSWLIFSAKITGSKGEVIGIDLKPLDIKNRQKLPVYVQTIVCDIFNVDEKSDKVIGQNYNVVLSDMAPSTTGIKDVDAVRSFNLCEAALELALEKLSLNGNFVCKIFHGNEFKEFIQLIKKNFQKYKIFKPETCRKSSREIYIIGQGKI